MDSNSPFVSALTWADIRFFKPSEFDSPDAIGSGRTGMRLPFVHQLDQVRANLGRPITISSGFRTAAHNRRVNGVDDSAHTTGWAADLRSLTSESRFSLVLAALQAGFLRIGISTTFVHLDADMSKPHPLIWLYPQR